MISPRLLLIVSLLMAPALVGGQADKCAVCGMFVDKYPGWVGVIRFKSGAPAYADGPKDLFRCLQDLRKYAPGRGEVLSIQVKDYYHLGEIDARKAFYVIGSDVLGPMGQELVPFATDGDAQAFLQDHHGKRKLRFTEITPELLKALE